MIYGITIYIKIVIWLIPYDLLEYKTPLSFSFCHVCTIFRIKEEDKRDYNTGKEMPDKPIYDGKKRIRNVRRYAKEQASMYAMLEAM